MDIELFFAKNLFLNILKHLNCLHKLFVTGTGGAARYMKHKCHIGSLNYNN